MASAGAARAARSRPAAAVIAAQGPDEEEEEEEEELHWNTKLALSRAREREVLEYIIDPSTRVSGYSTRVPGHSNQSQLDTASTNFLKVEAAALPSLLCQWREACACLHPAETDLKLTLAV